MRGYGDYAMPITATCTYGTAKKIVGDEMPTKRKNIRVTDADTVLRYGSGYTYKRHATSAIPDASITGKKFLGKYKMYGA